MPTGPFLDVLRGGGDALPPGPRTTSAEEVEQAHRRRLIAGMAEAAATKGYAQATIADVVSLAKVSRRTFYEHFPDKEACFVAAYEAASEVLVSIVEAAAGPDQRWDERIANAMEAYLRSMAGDPDLTRLFLVDILGAVPGALRARRRVNARFAAMLNEQVMAHADEAPAPLEWDPALATAIIGGVDELVRNAVEDGRAAELGALSRTASAFVRSVILPGSRVPAR